MGAVRWNLCCVQAARLCVQHKRTVWSVYRWMQPQFKRQGSSAQPRAADSRVWVLLRRCRRCSAFVRVCPRSSGERQPTGFRTRWWAGRRSAHGRVKNQPMMAPTADTLTRDRLPPRRDAVIDHKRCLLTFLASVLLYWHLLLPI